MVGSSWKCADTSGLAPIMSPAPITAWSGLAARSRPISVARYAAPPAGTRRDLPVAAGSGTSIVPGASILP